VTYPQQPDAFLPPPDSYAAQIFRRKQRRQTMWWSIAATCSIVAGLGIGLGIGSAGKTTASAQPGPTVFVTVPAPAITITTAAKPTAKPTPTHTTAPAPVIPDGYSVVVGQDVPAGTYSAYSTSSSCYWEIDKHATSDIIDNNIGQQGHIVRRLTAGEDFASHDCGDWHKV
jgi:hypothetical protein